MTCSPPCSAYRSAAEFAFINEQLYSILFLIAFHYHCNAVASLLGLYMSATLAIYIWRNYNHLTQWPTVVRYVGVDARGNLTMHPTLTSICTWHSSRLAYRSESKPDTYGIIGTVMVTMATNNETRHISSGNLLTKQLAAGASGVCVIYHDEFMGIAYVTHWHT